MPVAIPILAAVGSVSAGLAAGGILGGLMIAGGVLTGLGAITGNKTLSKYGGILSLAGGVGSLASGLAEQSASELARQASQESFRAGELAAQSAGEAGAAGTAGAAGAAGGTVDAAGASGVASLPDSVNTVEQGFGTTAKPELATGLAEGKLAVDSPIKSLLEQSAPAADAAKASPAEAFRTGELASNPAASSTGVESTSWIDKAKSMAKDTGKFIKDNNELVKAGTDLAGGAMAAYGQTDAIRTKLQLEDEARQRDRKRFNASVSGLRVQSPYTTPTTTGAR